MNLHPLPRLTAIALLLTAIALPAPACSKAETRVTADAISGTWFLQCRTKERSTTSCQSREERDITYQIWPGGELKRTTNGFDACTTSSWTLSGVELVLSCVGGGLTIDESWNVRLVDGRMVLYNDANRGRILVRDRAESPRPKGASSSPTKVQRTLGSIDYSVTIPAGYDLAEETSVSDRFDPKDTSRVRYRFKFGAVASAVGERGSCSPNHGNLVRGDDGAMSISCVDKPEGVFTLSCWAQHEEERPLTDEEFSEVETVCGSLSLK